MLQRMMKNRHRLQHFAAALAVSQLHRIVPEASVAKASTAAAAADLPRRVDQAKRLRDVYQTRFAFPEWSVELLERGELEQLSHKVTVYFPRGAHRGDVERLTKEREPVNIAMQRYYDKEKLQQFFGFTEGFYAKSSAEKLLPNIAIYCQTPMRSAGEQADVHVINVIGYAFDVPEQPDFQYFLSGRGKGTEEELVAKMRQMWRYIFICARDKGLKRVFLANVGGGAFSAELQRYHDYNRLKEASLEPVLKEFQGIEVRELPRIPHWVFGPEGKAVVAESLLVNAWDPWSMVGNGNAADNSLDGFFGRSTAMALLCWPITNPNLTYKEV
ncbi:unnamed protein product [Effrenium voratum]|uniref:Uncharacterized protein n=1 Tax=Effrenium voratum TaxID=2562239 RepID=A0AA36JN58_9DINO|nr:unnamed protein product [Effrenium voratum]CAJ1416783.1 unnamed protein product [Effrenium voratum]